MREYQPRETDEIDQKFFDQNPHRSLYLREPTVQEIFSRIDNRIEGDLMRLAVMVVRCRDAVGRTRFWRQTFIAPPGFVQSRRFKRLQQRIAREEPRVLAKIRQQQAAQAELRLHPQQIH
jgi:hypothetical protein